MSKHDQLEQLKVKTQAAHLPLKEGHNLVFGKGKPDAQIMFIGEAPGEKENNLCMPFVGSAGKQLDKLLSSIGMTCNDVYIANILKYRPPENRNPNDEEIRAHTPYLIEQIKIIRPKIIVTLGNFATKFALSCFDVEKMNDVEGITKLHGKVKKVECDGMPLAVFPVYHPAAVLHNPTLRPQLEEDFLLLGKIINTPPAEI